MLLTCRCVVAMQVHCSGDREEAALGSGAVRDATVSGYYIAVTQSLGWPGESAQLSSF